MHGHFKLKRLKVLRTNRKLIREVTHCILENMIVITHDQFIHQLNESKSINHGFISCENTKDLNLELATLVHLPQKLELQCRI